MIQILPAPISTAKKPLQDQSIMAKMAPTDFTEVIMKSMSARDARNSFSLHTARAEPVIEKYDRLVVVVLSVEKYKQLVKSPEIPVTRKKEKN